MFTWSIKNNLSYLALILAALFGRSSEAMSPASNAFIADITNKSNISYTITFGNLPNLTPVQQVAGASSWGLSKLSNVDITNSSLADVGTIILAPIGTDIKAGFKIDYDTEIRRLNIATVATADFKVNSTQYTQGVPLGYSLTIDIGSLLTAQGLSVDTTRWFVYLVIKDLNIYVDKIVLGASGSTPCKTIPCSELAKSYVTYTPGQAVKCLT